jgi:hypothetical protein
LLGELSTPAVALRGPPSTYMDVKRSWKIKSKVLRRHLIHWPGAHGSRNTALARLWTVWNSNTETVQKRLIKCHCSSFSVLTNLINYSP